MKKILEKTAGYAIWGLIFLLTISVVRSVQRTIQIKKQIEAQEAKITKIEEENNKLVQDLSQAQSSNFIEKEVRDKLGLGKEGEATVVLPDPEILKKLAPSIPESLDTLPDPNWKKWEKLFF
jgi:cell division protein FtsB